MYGRSTILFPLALLALLALLTLWIDRSVQEPEHQIDGSSRHDPDYIVNNFVTTKTDASGNLRYSLAAVEMRHYPDDDSTKLLRPHFTQYVKAKAYASIEGQHGFVSSNGDNVQFMDNVKVVRSASKEKGEMVMLTQFLNVAPDTEIATTDQPVVITQAPATVIHGTGMIFDKKQRTVKLLKQVRVHYLSPRTAQARAARRADGQPVASQVKTDVPAASTLKPGTLSTNKLPGKKNSANNTKRMTTNQNRPRRHYEHPASP